MKLGAVDYVATPPDASKLEQVLRAAPPGRAPGMRVDGAEWVR
jgi:hypothetical protein